MAPVENKGILIITPFFSPNIGGTERQLDDLVQALDENNYNVYVQTYSPLTTSTSWQKHERWGKHIFINRYHWFGRNLFHKVEKYPLIDFLYLAPYLLLRTFFWLIFNHHSIDTIHAQGLNASLIGVILHKIFNKRLITSIHAIYEINPRSITAKLNYLILNFSQKILATSPKSLEELKSFGIPENKLAIFIPWVDQKIFKPYDQAQCRKELGLDQKFTVFFLSRLIRKKGARTLIKVAKTLPQINFIFAGIGPDADFIRSQQNTFPNIIFAGTLPRDQIPKYFSASDIYCFPTQYEEGFGLVLPEALSCGTPIVTSNKGAIPKVVDPTVAVLVDPTVANLKKAILNLYQHPQKLAYLKSNTLRFARKYYSSKNVLLISRYY